MGSGVEKHELSVSIYHWLMGDSTLQDTVVATVGHYDLVPSNIDLTAAEVALMQFDEREFVITMIERTTSCLRLHHCRLSALTEHSDGECIAAATGVLVPMQCEYYALEGLSALLDTVEGIRPRRTPTWKSRGCCEQCTTPGTASVVTCPDS